MALKGSMSIQLFDAETGKKQREIREDNMITNAVSKLLNLPLDFLVGSSLTPYTVLKTSLPIQTAAMGGVLIFGNKIEENAEHISAGYDEIPVGHAGDEYSGTDAYTGTYNTNESGPLENGYRHVWDFATDKANGDIACVCLTSKTGGNSGFSTTNTTTYGMQMLSNPTVFSISDSYGKIAGCTAKGEWCRARIDNQTVTLTYYNGFNSDRITLGREAGVGAEVSRSVELVFDSFTNTHSDYTDFYVDSDGVLKFCTSVNTSLGSYLYSVEVQTGEVDIKAGTKKAFSAVTVDFSTFPQGRYYVRQDGYYAYNNCTIMAFTEKYIVCNVRLSGSKASELGLSDNPYELVLLDRNGKFAAYSDNVHWSNYNVSAGNLYDTHNRMLWLKDENKCGYWLTEDGNVVVRANGYGGSSWAENRNIYCYKDIYPYVLRLFSSNSAKGAYLCLDFCYLATINNLAKAVTKTSTQTMKITYDITES